MKKFKIGQTVYYYRTLNESFGDIVRCVVRKVTKDLSSKKITYSVSSDEFFVQSTIDLSADYLYPTLKAALKEHRDEIAYNELNEKLRNIESLLYKVIDEYSEKIAANPQSWVTIDANNVSTSLVIEGIGNIKEEFDKLKKEVNSIKKKIKKPTKKSVVKEKNNHEPCKAL